LAGSWIRPPSPTTISAKWKDPLRNCY